MTGAAVKASREVRIGDVISARIGELSRTVKVLGLIEKRVGPKLVSEYLEDLTPAEEYLRVMRKKEDQAVPKRPKGAGRPTKKDRRSIAKLTDSLEG
jgi:ribosome-associated heat shock protein Hsp15